MKKVIDGKLYDTATATKVADSVVHTTRDGGHWGCFGEDTAIYKTSTGNWFIYGRRKPTRMLWTKIAGSERIAALTEEEAKNVLSERTDVYANHFEMAAA